MTGPTEHPLDGLRAALRYQQGYDVAGWEAHLRDDEITAKHDAALLAVEQLEKAARDLMENGGWGHSHWDSTGQHGAGCPTCIQQRETKERARAALAPFDRKEQP